MELNDIIQMIQPFGKNHSTFWGCALADEVGGICEVLKKTERDNTSMDKNILSEEIADVFNYLILLSKEYDIDFEKSVLDKIEKRNKYDKLSKQLARNRANETKYTANEIEEMAKDINTITDNRDH